MHTIKALQQRKSVRAFLDKEVEVEKINTILSAASHAPSGANTQPWQVAVVSGQTKKKLQTQIEQSFRLGERGNADYQYYPKQWDNPYKLRRIHCGQQMYDTLEIERRDKQRRLDQWAANYRSFDAPVMLLFFMDRTMKTGSYLDYGMFLQSIMLAAVEQGLATCAQASLADYPEIIKTTLGYPQDTILLCGMALGYEDTEALINSYRTPREDVNSFTQYFS
jgi:nitroreductase